MSTTLSHWSFSDRLKQKADRNFVAHRDDLHPFFERVLVVNDHAMIKAMGRLQRV